MSINHRNSLDAATVVASVGRGSYGLSRHDLPGGVAISYVYDGDEDRPGTCQWRVIAPDFESLRQAVQQLTASLDRVGVTYDPPRFSETVCHFQDRGPWQPSDTRVHQSLTDFVPETAIDYEEIFRRGGRNLGDEDFALFKCPSCHHIYLIDYEVDTVYLDGDDLSRRTSVVEESFDCVKCGRRVPDDQAWIGPKAHPKFGVTWQEVQASPWSWVARPMDGGASAS